MRFVLFFCALLGMLLWWHIAPPQLFLHPSALCCCDLSAVLQMCKDTFVNLVCCTHPDVPSPCPCGEPLNSSIRHIIPNTELRFDPLGVSPQENKFKSAALIVGFVVVTLALSESVSEHGIYVGF
ncbi:hypothetical protein COLO4_02498 [Corchorus olitorius]|uniref:Uncharacterized protein n=2 Tax=Corchorus olitorius TaxID=93759 RepID=A0A1R3L0W8_9ROSI|nr:hypothetical protein COLO4_02498 [Corchorus olitorius]